MTDPELVGQLKQIRRESVDGNLHEIVQRLEMQVHDVHADAWADMVDGFYEHFRIVDQAISGHPLPKNRHLSVFKVQTQKGGRALNPQKK